MEERSKTANLENKKVFIVEDDLLFQDMLATKLSKTGAIIIHTENGTEALAQIPNKKPDVILLDLLLPGNVDGFGVLEKIKDIPELKNIPVIIISNLSETKDLDRGMKLGAYRYLVKSMLDLNDIPKYIESALSDKK